jgi:hypothetical protein
MRREQSSEYVLMIMNVIKHIKKGVLKCGVGEGWRR